MRNEQESTNVKCHNSDVKNENICTKGLGSPCQRLVNRDRENCISQHSSQPSPLGEEELLEKTAPELNICRDESICIKETVDGLSDSSSESDLEDGELSETEEEEEKEERMEIQEMQVPISGKIS